MGDIVSGTVFEIFQYFSLSCAIFTVYYIIRRAVLNKCWILDIPLLLLMLHGIIYYGYIIFVRVTPYDTTYEFLTFWSTILRFHGYATLLIISVTNYIKEKQKWGKR
jgi:hypothetical protein